MNNAISPLHHTLYKINNNIFNENDRICKECNNPKSMQTSLPRRYNQDLLPMKLNKPLPYIHISLKSKRLVAVVLY